MPHAMPEATVLYSVTAMVVTGLVLWVGAVLRSAREPWARPLPQAIDVEPLPPVDPAVEPAGTPASAGSPEAAPSPATPPIDADETAKATPVALSDGKRKVLEAEEAEAAAAAKNDDEAKA